MCNLYYALLAIVETSSTIVWTVVGMMFSLQNSRSIINDFRRPAFFAKAL
ncbi:hypothetical protein NEISUBOT_04134 [Neisseria subflava NJ9703]|uniref:Uncharacterized protein n=1 Tax=Neisseria subflava NJ9703 TaxID=546268 RepID=A0A9W5MZL4_NEISU|nr:hypothetical protein NEISUBOT_04134 [Neisseria subflava NJ9703]